MDKDKGKKLREQLHSHLVAPIKEELKTTNASITRLRWRLLILKAVLVLGICLHLWCGFMETHSWLWLLYIIALIVI
ncbi:MAG: hypothetical protein IJS08_07100 [Victivallales bacterium]|nr:hypothetical protein [Victivallales bacterium]